MSHIPPHGRPAYIEDFNEEDNTTLPETRQTANVAAKRSKPDSPKIKGVRKVKDEFSDSGYSSHTAATPANEDPQRDLKGGKAPSSNALVRALSRRRPTVEKRSESTPRVRMKAPAQVGSFKAKEHVRYDPNCADCAARGRESVKPPELKLPSKHLPSKQASQPEQGASSKPTAPIAVPTRVNPEVQHIQPRPRAATAQSHRPQRPVSYHAGVAPQMMYIQPMYPERQYSPAYPGMSPMSMPSHQPPNIPYFPPAPPPPQARPPPPDTYLAPPLPYEFQPRLDDRQWFQEPHRPPRNSTLYNIPPPVEYAQQPILTTIAPSQPVAHYPIYHQDHPQPRIENFPRTEDRYRMPPPPLPPHIASQQRPELRHAATTHPVMQRQRSDQGAELVRVQSSDGRFSDGRLRKVRTEEHNVSKRPPLATIPSYGPGDDKPLTRRSDPVVKAESSAKEKKRFSHYGHEQQQVEKEREVEAYQASHGGPSRTVQPLPLTDSSLKLVRKKTRSDTASRVSGDGKVSRSGSSVKSRTSTDHKRGSDVKARHEKDDGVKMRFNASQDINVNFKGGGVDDRTISLRPSGDRVGEMELRIGAKEKPVSDRERHMAEKDRHMREREETMGIRSKRLSYGGGEAEVTRSVSRIRKDVREIEDRKEREARLISNRSRRSSRSGYSGKTYTEQYRRYED